jgi:hypothetical protein
MAIFFGHEILTDFPMVAIVLTSLWYKCVQNCAYVLKFQCHIGHSHGTQNVSINSSLGGTKDCQGGGGREGKGGTKRQSLFKIKLTITPILRENLSTKCFAV